MDDKLKKSLSNLDYDATDTECQNILRERYAQLNNNKKALEGVKGRCQ